MSNGIHNQPGSGTHNPPPGVSGTGGAGTNVQHETAVGNTPASDQVGRGFSRDNSVSFSASEGKQQGAYHRDRPVPLPAPTFDHAKVTPEIQAQFAHLGESTELFTFDELLDHLSTDRDDESTEEGSSVNTPYGFAPKTKGQGQRGGDSRGRDSGDSQIDTQVFVNGGAKLAANAENAEQLVDLYDQTFDVLDKISSIESAPPKVLEGLQASGDRLSQAVLKGDIENIALILAEVQTKIQNTRIKFDEEGIRANRLQRKQTHQERIGKLNKSLAKLKQAKKAGLIGKIFGAIATALTVVVAAITIATGVGVGVGLALIAAATIMVMMTISQSTGNWMSSLGGLIKSDKGKLAMGIIWSLLVVALSLGAGLASSTAKASTDAATTTVQQGANAAAQTAKAAAKTAIDDVAAQATKTTVKVAKEATKETAKEASQNARNLALKQFSHITRAFQSGTQIGDGASQITSSKIRYDGAAYRADAQEDLAFITKLGFQMDDWVEAIQRALQEITTGQTIASDILAETLENKFTISRNI